MATNIGDTFPKIPTIDKPKVEAGITPESVTTEGMQPHEILVAMEDAGANTTTLLDYIKERPDAVRGAEATQLAQRLGGEITEFVGLVGEARVTKARELGILPADFDALSQELKDAYAVSDQAFNTAVEAFNKDIQAGQVARVTAAKATKEEREAALDNLSAFREDQRYNLQKAFDAGKGADVYAARALDLFTPEAVMTAQFASIEERFRQKAIAELETTHTLIKPKDAPEAVAISWIPTDVLNSIREQSEYGYKILTEQGVEAYDKAVEDAVAELKQYQRPSGYRLKPAVAAGVSKDTLSLLFRPVDVDKAWLVKIVPEAVPDVETEPATTSGLPPGLVAVLPVLGAVAVAEPTLIGEIIVGGVLITAVAVAAIQGKDIKWGALWDDITGTFQKETGREPSTTEVAEMETVAASIIKASPISVTDMPPAVAFKATEQLPTFLDGTKAITIPSIPAITRAEPLPAIPAITRAEPLPGIPAITRAEPQVAIPAFEGKIELPNVMEAQAQVATAEKELDDTWVIIRPKLATPGKDLPAVIPKTTTALVALDAAVQDAFTAGEIDADTLRVYSQARTNYLSAKGALDAASRTYIGGLQPQLVSNTQNLTALAFSLALSDLQNQASKAASEAYSQAITQGLTQAQARTIAQSAAQNAITTATQTAVQSAVESITRTMVVTDTATISAVQTATQAAINTATATMTQTATTAATAVAPVVPIPRLPKGGGFKRTGKVEPGTVEWRQGIFWRYLEPPIYKPLETSKTPLPGTYKFATGEDSAYKTIQVIGGMPTKDIRDIDIGIAIVTIIRKGKELEIQFKQDVEDAYKGKVVKEKITTVRTPAGVPKFTTESDGRIKLTEKPKIRRSKPQPIPLVIKDTATTQKPEKKKEEVGVASGRYYLGHRLPDSNVRVDL